MEPLSTGDDGRRWCLLKHKEGIAMKTLPLLPVAWTLAIFAAVVFALDMLAGVAFPNWWVMQKAWELVLPGFRFISWGSFVAGLAESFLGGLLTALLFVPVYNRIAARRPSEAGTTLATSGQHRM